jgi:4-hydroxybenzoate polyprenyltransferase
MSMILHAVIDMHAAGQVMVQQFENVAPEAPPAADRIMRLLRWMMWFVMLSGLTGIIFAGGKFAWEKWTGGALESPKMVAGAAIGGVVATSAGTIMNAVIG